MPWGRLANMDDNKKASTDVANQAPVKTSSRKAQWQEQILAPALKKSPERLPSFTTLSGVPIEPLYTPDDLDGFDASESLGNPGEFPFTRGIHSTMYRGKVWTMRQFSGFGSPA